MPHPWLCRPRFGDGGEIARCALAARHNWSDTGPAYRPGRARMTACRGAGVRVQAETSRSPDRRGRGAGDSRTRRPHRRPSPGRARRAGLRLAEANIPRREVTGVSCGEEFTAAGLPRTGGRRSSRSSGMICDVQPQLPSCEDCRWLMLRSRRCYGAPDAVRSGCSNPGAAASGPPRSLWRFERVLRIPAPVSVSKTVAYNVSIIVAWQVSVHRRAGHAELAGDLGGGVLAGGVHPPGGLDHVRAHRPGPAAASAS